MSRLFAVVALLLLPWSAAAAAEDPASTPATPAAPTASTTEIPYLVGVRDVLNIEVYGEKDLSGSFPVGEDGTLDFPLVGRVPVSGLTPSDIDQTLTSLLARDFLQNPQVTVRIEGYSSQPVQVLGSVGKPGTVYLVGPTRLLDILTLAGGIKDEGATEVRVSHKAQPDKPDLVSLEQLVTFGTNNVPIQPGDVVYVPPGPLIFVSGEVLKPGTVTYRDGLTAVQAINKAGGATGRANLRRVYLLRDGVRTRINARKVIHGNMADVVLKPDDHLIVNESVF